MVSIAKFPIQGAIALLKPSQLKQLYKQLRIFFNQKILTICVKSSRLSSVYYAFFSSAMDRENQGVIYGKLQYQKSLTDIKEPQYLLRRNTHRLEKGLIMRPRRDTFALDYIEETVIAYQNLATTQKQKADANSELKWAYDVLKEYFSAVKNHPVVDRARSIFEELDEIPGASKCIPYQRDLDTSSSVDYEQFLALSHRRRSVRWYLQKPVPRELIDRAIFAAALSPSACNRQPFEFRVFDEPEKVQKVASIPMGTVGFSQNFPVVIVVVGKLRAYSSERDRHVIYIDASLAAMSLMYALETLGLSSCPINWPDIAEKEREMNQTLGLEPDERVIMLISLGYPNPEGMVPYSQKKSLNEIRRYN